MSRNSLPISVNKKTRRRPCPFCRLGPLQVVDTPGEGVSGTPMCVECINCGARGPIYGDAKSAELGWLHGEADGHTEEFSLRVAVEEALLRLVIHDVSSDKREKTDHCLELENAISVLKEDCGYTDNMYLLEGTTEG